MPNKAPIEVRFWEKVQKREDGCWIWVGTSRSAGGRIWTGRDGQKPRLTCAARVSLRLHGVSVPEGSTVLHLCGNRLCVNPDHLEVSTARERAPWKQRFWSQVKKGDGCWEWTGTKNRNGRGVFHLSGRSVSAYRVSWELHNGAVPAGLLVCHRCDNPSCVRPGHLFLGTSKDNTGDMISKGRDNFGGLGSKRSKGSPHG